MKRTLNKMAMAREIVFNRPADEKPAATITRISEQCLLGRPAASSYYYAIVGKQKTAA